MIEQLISSNWTVPTFWTADVMMQFWNGLKQWLKFAAPVVMLYAAIYYGGEVIEMVKNIGKRGDEVDQKRRRRSDDDDDEDD